MHLDILATLILYDNQIIYRKRASTFITYFPIKFFSLGDYIYIHTIINFKKFFPLYFWFLEGEGACMTRCNVRLAYLAQANRVYSYRFAWRDIKEIYSASIAFSLSMYECIDVTRNLGHIDPVWKSRRPATAARLINTFQVYCFMQIRY